MAAEWVIENGKNEHKISITLKTLSNYEKNDFRSPDAAH